jgi:L-amino acid N-acyltransferase YncA
MTAAIRPLLPTDWDAVRRIYVEGIASGDATFETEAPDWDQWNRAHRGDCRLAVSEGNTLLGWAALSPVSTRAAYGGVAEVSVYVAATARGRGLGEALLRALIRVSEESGVWTLQAGIFPENEASVRLHERMEFRRVGVRRRIGRLDGRWRDTLLFERRSETVGSE